MCSVALGRKRVCYAVVMVIRWFSEVTNPVGRSCPDKTGRSESRSEWHINCLPSFGCCVRVMPL